VHTWCLLTSTTATMFLRDWTTNRVDLVADSNSLSKIPSLKGKSTTLESLPSWHCTNWLYDVHTYTTELRKQPAVGPQLELWFSKAATEVQSTLIFDRWRQVTRPAESRSTNLSCIKLAKSIALTFSSLTLSVGRQEEHPACKNLSDEVHSVGYCMSITQTCSMVICLMWCANDLHMVQHSSWRHCHPIISWFMKIWNGLTFLVPAYPGCPGKEVIKWMSKLGKSSHTNATAIAIITITATNTFGFCLTVLVFWSSSSSGWVIQKKVENELLRFVKHFFQTRFPSVTQPTASKQQRC